MTTVYLLVVFAFLAVGNVKVNAQCASGWSCYGTRVTDHYDYCTTACTRHWTRIDPHVCGAGCEAVLRYVASCVNDCTTYNNNCARCGQTCGSWYCEYPNDGTCRWESVSCGRDIDCGPFGPCVGESGCQLTRDCSCKSCTLCNCIQNSVWSSCAPGSTTNCYNCCIRDPDPPPPPPPSCDANPGSPILGNPINGFTTNDTNTVDFDWSANGWGGSDCGNRAFRFQIDDDNDWSN